MTQLDRRTVIGQLDVATCPLPGCGSVLRIEVSRAGCVYADGTADADLTSTWSIGCEQGHVLLLPPDTAEDYYEYDEAASGRLRDLLEIAKPLDVQLMGHRSDEWPATFPTDDASA